MRYSQVCTHKVHAWALESGKAGGIGANSSWYGGCSAHQRERLARHSCCSQRTHRSACVELEVNVTRQFTPSLSSNHVAFD